MRVRIDLPEMRADYDAHMARNLRYGWTDRWHPEQSSPRPEWHGREVEMIGPGVILFPGAKLAEYQLIDPKHLVIL